MLLCQSRIRGQNGYDDRVDSKNEKPEEQKRTDDDKARVPDVGLGGPRDALHFGADVLEVLEEPLEDVRLLAGLLDSRLFGSLLRLALGELLLARLLRLSLLSLLDSQALCSNLPEQLLLEP